MSRSVSAPSSVTKTSPCWNGFIVPGSTLRYGSSFCMVTRRPRLESRAPSELAVSPLPSEDTTPPVTKTNFVGWELCRRPRDERDSGVPDGRSTGDDRNTIRVLHRVGVRSATRGLPPDGVLGPPRGGQPDQQRHQERRGGRGERDTGVVDRGSQGQAQGAGEQPRPQDGGVGGREPRTPAQQAARPQQPEGGDERDRQHPRQRAAQQ